MPASRASPIWVDVMLRGPLFSKKISPVVKSALVDECIKKINVRMQRGGKGLGAKGNVVTAEMAFGEQLAGEVTQSKVASTLHNPRTKGTSWVRKNVAIARAMSPRVLRKAAQRIAGDLS